LTLSHFDLVLRQKRIMRARLGYLTLNHCRNPTPFPGLGGFFNDFRKSLPEAPSLLFPWGVIFQSRSQILRGGGRGLDFGGC
jgi:hypothetical protein